jgi:signal transduction histidine kinase/DNA-binding response OmpR family regulator
MRAAWHLSRTNGRITEAMLKETAAQHAYRAIAFFDDSLSHGLPPTNTAVRRADLERAQKGETLLLATETASKEIVLRIYTPLRKGVLVVTLPGNALGDIFSGFHLLGNGRLFLLEQDGSFLEAAPGDAAVAGDGLIRTERSEQDAGMAEALRRMRQGESGIGEHVRDGTRHVVAFGPQSGAEGWSLGVSVPVAEMAFARSRAVLLLAEAMILLVGGGLAFLAAKRLAQPFLVIEEQEESLRALRKTAAEAQEAKRDFFANISHEMRTPLNAIIGLSEHLLEAGNIPPESQHSLRNIHDSGITLLRITNDILEISKIESGKTKIILVEYDLPGVIRDTVRQNLALIAEKPVRLILRVDETLPVKLLGDVPRVREIFATLLGNACKHTQEGTVAWFLSWERRGDEVWLVSTIEDTGHGIWQDDGLESIFSSPEEEEAWHNSNIEGAGLGLVVTRKLVDMMGGEIRVESEHGKGSTCTARFRQHFLTETIIGREGAASLERLGEPGGLAAADARTACVQLPEARVLVVDDFAVSLEATREILQAYGMQIDCAGSGPEAIERIRAAEVRYNAVFMDHMMPGMDGIEATHVIRTEIGTDYAKTVPIIALTANALAGNEKIFLSQGFQEYLTKPVDPEQMDPIIRYWVRDRRVAPHASANMLAQAARHDIVGIDWKKGREHFGGDEESYRSALEAYATNTTRLLVKIRAVQEETQAEYADAIRDIREGSYDIGAEQIGEQAETLEHAVLDGKFDFVSQGNPIFIALLEKLLADIRTEITMDDDPS